MTATLPAGIERVLFTEEQIERRIDEIAGQISDRYKDKNLKLIGVLKGSVFFLAALARKIKLPLKIDFLAISSFSNKSGAPGLVRIAKDLDDSIDRRYRIHITLSSADSGQPGSQFARGLYLSGSQLAPYRSGSSGLPLFRDSRSFCHRLRPRLQPALSQSQLRCGSQT